MKRVIWFAPVLLFFCASARAQQIPAWEIYGGYTYADANFSGPGPSVSFNGGSASVDENLNDWIGGRLDFNFLGGKISGENVTAQTFSYGPVFSYRKFERLTPYAVVEVGAIHASPGYLGTSVSAFKFALTGGGGVDYKISDRAAVRIQAAYLMTRFFSMRQDNLLFSTGLVIRIGKK